MVIHFPRLAVPAGPVPGSLANLKQISLGADITPRLVSFCTMSRRSSRLRASRSMLCTTTVSPARAKAEQPFPFRTLSVLTRSLVTKEPIDRDMLELAFRVLVEAAHPDLADAVDRASSLSGRTL